MFLRNPPKRRGWRSNHRYQADRKGELGGLQRFLISSIQYVTGSAIRIRN